MSGGSRIIAFGSGSQDPAPEPQHTEAPRADELAIDESWAIEEEPAPRRSSRGLVAPIVALLTIAGWTAFYLWANSGLLTGGITPQQGIALLSGWSLPVLLVCTFWLIALRTSTREAARFNDAARQLGDESLRLEQRLSTVNSELSLAREFIASQSRDLESLGRIAAERLSQHAERLDGLIKSNSSQIEAIASVSTSALDNMERLRGNLPVIVSSAKDVTNNIGNAGRAAQGHLQELINGFNKLNEFGQASERQVTVLRERVDETLGLYSQQVEQIEAGVSSRFAALEQHSSEFRARLDGHEVETLAAIRSRAAALVEEFDGTRRRLDEHEAESLGSLRTRLSTLRDESTTIARSLRDGETNALNAWRSSLGRLDEDIRGALSRLEELDRQAMEAAKGRLDDLTEDAARLDRELAERGLRFDEDMTERRARAREGEDEILGLLRQRFAAIDAEIALRRSDASDHDELALQSLRERLALLDDEIGRRRTDAAAQEERELEGLRTRLARLDDEITRRRTAQEAHSRALVGHTEAIAAQLEAFSEHMREVVAHGDEAGTVVATSLQTLADRLSESRNALAGTDEAVVALTDASVRLLELIQAGATHAREDLPRAIEAGEARLEAAQARVFMLRDVAREAAEQGESLSGHVIASQDQLTSALVALDALHDGIGAKADAYRGQLGELHRSVEALNAENATLVEQSQGALRSAIEQLTEAARAAVRDIEAGSAQAVSAVAQQLGEESAAALDRVVRARAAEVAGQLEEAATHAAGVSREAAIQLRDQLAKVNELAGNLERRVTHARERAEQQVDNDFARRSALITEALNSNAIDIAKALDSDVSDTAWASYLKGDRGIFTRRAVTLLETGEARSVQQLYETDRDFREHVSHYIHDFEGMLRQLLSTRDGHALGVTVLSSDMGKLYVALAQSIERLRG